MTVTERVAYLKGLFEGLGIDGEKKEGKVLKGMLDTLEELAYTVTDLEQQNAELMDELDEIYEDLSAIEEDLGMDNDFDTPDENLYQVICPTCDENIYIDDEMLAEGSIRCPACGEALEFDLSALDEDYDEAFEDDDEDETFIDDDEEES